MLRRTAVIIATVAGLVGGVACAQADVVIVVNKSTQRLAVSVNGALRYEWPVSTARQGYNTPNGTYRPERLERQWFSRRYDWSPMPHSIFFDGGYAIHGSYEIGRLGTPASHGCIRLHPNNAAVLYSLVQANRSATRIVVTGDRPSQMMVRSGHHPHAYADVPPRALHKNHRPAPRYVEDEDFPAPSLRGSRVRSRQTRGSFEEIFN